MLLELIFAVISLATPEVLRMAIGAIENKSVLQLKACSVFAIMITIVYVAITSAIKLLEQHTINICEQTIQNNILEKLFSLKKLRIKQYSSGEIITLISQNTPNAVKSSLAFLFQTSQGLAIIIVGIVYMGMLNVKLMIAMVLFNVILRIFSMYFENRIKESSIVVSITTKENNSFLIDLLNNIMTIRVFDRIEYFKNRLLLKETYTMKANCENFSWHNGFSEIIWFMQKAAQVCIAFGFGGYLVLRGEIGFSIILAFTMAIDLFTKGINAIMFGMADKSNAFPNIEAIMNFLNDPEIENKMEGSSFSIENLYIKFANVSFSFGETEVLKNVSFEILPNEKVMIEGANGEGKSTLLNLILGLYRPNSGVIYYGNYDISQMDINDISKNYSYISQNSHITIGNSYQNVILADSDRKNDVEDIFKKLNLSHIQQNDPQSYSNGEKQRLNIARALLKAVNVRLIVGDEIFSNIDAENKKKIADELTLLFSNKTVVMVCHDDMNLKFDKKLVIANKTVQQFSL